VQDDGENEAEEQPLNSEETLEVLDANMLLFKAARVANVGVMLESLALGADKNWINFNEGASTALHQAVLGGSVTACEFLMLNGARVNAVDSLKRTPIWLATEKGHTGQICLFLRNRADYHLPDSEGKSPLDMAIKSEHADIVTLLRLAHMNEEMNEESNQTDDTFQEIVRDIAQRAHAGQESPSTTQTQLDDVT